jgi:hypothetical protein
MTMLVRHENLCTIEEGPDTRVLFKLALVLPVATISTVERCFSAMRIVKTYFRNRLSDDALKYNLICYVEK